MRTRYMLLLCVLCLFAWVSTTQAQTYLTAQLTAAQANVETDGTPVGTAAMVLTEEGLRYYVSVDGLSGGINAAHFHEGPLGVSGGIVHPITFEGTRASGLWPATGDGAMSDEMRTALLTGGLYINVHTEDHPPGEIRGQVLPTSGTSLTAALTPEQETGDVTSDGSGTATVQLTNAGAIYHVTVDGLTGDISAAHFHIGEAGVAGGVVRGITFEDNTAFGVWTATDAEPLVDSLVTHLLLGNLYLNVHTPDYPPGEIRGQVVLNGGLGFEARLNADNETNEVDSDGLGTGTFTLTEAGLIYRITAADLTGPIQAAHFHRAPAGTDGGIVRTLLFNGSTAAGVWRWDDDEPLSDELIQDLLAGGLYVNLHTQEYPAGEVRGQVTRVEGTHLSAALTAAQSGTESDGVGTASMVLTEHGLAYQVTVDGLTGPINAAHFHVGAAGMDGGVEHGINFVGHTASGEWAAGDMTDEQLLALLTGGLYINVHTPDNPPGEIRGQVMVTGGAGLAAQLTNAQSGVDGLNGSGTLSATMTDAGMIYRATVTGLSGNINAAHFHDAPAGASSGVARTVIFDGPTTSGVWQPGDGEALTDARQLEVLTGGIYLNVHTPDNPPGEIRGQLHLADGFGRAVQMDTESETGEVNSDGHGTASATLTGAGLVFHATVSQLTGPITAAHFHRAPLGESGGVVRGVTFDGMNLSGVWRGTDDEPLNVGALQAFFADELYLNVHTDAHPPGEIRGQLDRIENESGTAAEPIGEGIPSAFGLDQNYPNPFNPSTTITFRLREPADATLVVFDALGRHVATLHDGPLAAGQYRVAFEAAGLPSGTYFYRLATETEVEVRRMIVVK